MEPQPHAPDLTPITRARVDLHAHPSMKTYLVRKKLHKSYRTGGAFNPFAMRTTVPKLIAGKVNVLLSAIYLPEKGLLSDCALLKTAMIFAPKRWRDLFKADPFDRTLLLLDDFEHQVGKTPPVDGISLEIAKTKADVPGIISRNNLALIHSIEGLHSLNGDARNVEKLFDRGVALMTLAHFYENGVSPPVDAIPKSYKKFGCFKKKKDLTLGLTALGRDVVEEMVRLGIVVDLTHSTPIARTEVLRIVGSRRPVVMSHVGHGELMSDPKNPDATEVRRIADTGGLVGIIFMNHWLRSGEHKNGINLIVETARLLRRDGGIGCVALGSDFDGMTDPPDDLADHADLDHLVKALVTGGFSTGEVEKIMGGNALRVLQDGWGR